MVEEAYRMAREINAQILSESDNDIVKTMKIFYWVHKNISFILSTPAYGNWAVAAINTFTKRYSSCYGTWAVCKAMMDVELQPAEYHDDHLLRSLRRRVCFP